MHKQRWQQGFLMIEVVVAIVIISMALLVIAGLFIQATSATRNSDNYTVAANLAQKQLELLKSNWSQAYWKELPKDIEWQDTTFDPTKDLSPAVTVVTSAKQSTEHTNLVEVTVTASWSEQGKPYSVRFTTFFPKQ